MSKKRQILNRIVIVYTAFVLVGAAIVGKIAYIQFAEGAQWRERAESTTYKNMVLSPNRGDICATDGRVLSSSVPYYEIRMDLMASGLTDRVFTDNIDSLAICLSALFKNQSKYAYRSELTNARKLDKGRRYYRIGNRNVDYLELQQLRKFPLFRMGANKGGLIIVPSNKRKLTHGALAARTLGTINAGGVAVGIEGAFDYALRGREGFRVYQRIPGNNWVPAKSADEIEPEDGTDVITTIDVDIQDVADAALRRSLSRHGADHGCAVLMEVATGDIKAIANLKRTPDGGYTELYNYAIGEASEPGSTMKVATLIALLEDGLITLDDSINTGSGRYRIYDKDITDSRHGGYGLVSVREAFELSSNIAMVKLVSTKYKGKEKDFVNRLYAMRLNQPLGLPIAGEGAPYIKYPGDKLWSGLSMPMMSMGYEVSLTPLQMLTLYNAIANKGKMVKPRFVKALKKHGQTVQTFPTEVLASSICSRSTLRQVHEALEGVVERGTAKNLRNAHYRIAGKTGTAQVAKGTRGYRHQGTVSYQASFAGYFPAEAPKYSCIVVVNSPSNSVYYGNVVAGPVFKEIADKVYATNPEWFGRVDRSTTPEPPQCKNTQTQQLARVLGDLRVPYTLNADPKGWATTTRSDEQVVLNALTPSTSVIPNVVGMGLRDAIYLLENSGVKVRFSGFGTVRAQSVTPGSTVVPGSTVQLEMSST